MTMQHQAIICFAKDRHEAATSNHHVMHELARDRTVVWLNSVSTRRPKLTSSRDLGKIVRKLREFVGGPRRDTDGVWVFTPLVLPFPELRVATTINRQVLRATIWWLRRRLGIEEFQVWSFLPAMADYVGAFGESLVVFYCVDEWSLFHYVDRESTARADALLTRNADVVFAACQELVDAKAKLNPNTVLATHGVDYELFRLALLPGPVPHDVASLEGPVLGFYGTIESWVDLSLIAWLAQRHPEWNFVMIGPIHTSTRELDELPNVHLLGPRPHDELPNYCRRFDVGLIPYVMSERMRYVNPLKLREYLSAGLPVVSTPVPEAKRYQPACRVADGKVAFEAAVVDALREDSAAARVDRSRAMKNETWRTRVHSVSQTVSRVMEAKDRARAVPRDRSVAGCDAGNGPTSTDDTARST